MARRYQGRSDNKASSQLDLFAAAVMATTPKTGGAQDDSAAACLLRLTSPSHSVDLPVSSPTPALAIASPSTGAVGGRQLRSRLRRSDIRVVARMDLPNYPELDHDLVDRSIAALPEARIWFTYAAIRECFGVSRATVARKVKEGLVPGIRFCGTNVLEDGPVRRFDRDQLRWLLLAIRRGKP